MFKLIRTAMVISVALQLLLAMVWGTSALADQPSKQESAGGNTAYTANWIDFQPQGWVVQVPFTATVTVTDTHGVVTTTAEYRTSTDGGTTWSIWTRANLTAVASVSTTAFLTTTQLTMADASAKNKIQFRITDTAGVSNTSAAYNILVDTLAPSTTLNALPARVGQITFTVSWAGSDNADGSGIASFDIQAKDGAAGAWQDWLNGVTSTSAAFSGLRGHVYYFRSRGIDVAGNQEPYPSGNLYASTFVQSFANGDFELGSLAGWQQGGDLSLGLIQGGVHPLLAATTWMAQLGDPSYGSGSQGDVPPNSSASISQEIHIPSLTDIPVPILSFWYRIFTYDVVYGCPPGETDPNEPTGCKVTPNYLYDSFDVTIESDSQSARRVLRDGNFDRSRVGTLVDTGWKKAFVDLRPYAGQAIHVRFANWNRSDPFYNTWTYLDDVRIEPPGNGSFVFLPLALRSSGKLSAGEQARPVRQRGPGPRR